MKKCTAQKIIFAILFSCFFVSFLTPPAYATAGLNRTINFQGKVVNKADGTNISDGNYTFVFGIYNASTAGTQLWGNETQTTIPVTNGIFTVALGSIRTFATDNLDFNQDNLWLDITFNGENFGSRVRLASVPYAMTAEKVNGLTVTATTGTFTLANAKTLTVNNTLTLSGTDTTSFTFPTTSAGTVLTSNAPTQAITSAQTSGTVLGITDSSGTAASTGLAITLAGSGAVDQTGLSFALSGATGANLNDILGSGSTWKISKTGALTVASCTGCGGGGATLQTAYAAGNTITTTTGSDIAFVLPAGLGTRTKFSLTNNDTTAGSDFYLNSANASGTSTSGLFLEQTGTGILTNGLNITRTAGTLTNGLVFNGIIGTDITSTDTNKAITIKSTGNGALTLDSGSNTGAVNLGNTNANALTLGNTTNTATITINSSATTGTGATSAFVFNDTALTLGTGLQITPGNPKVDNNSGILTSGKVINASSANHTYMSLDNRDLTIGGHKNNITLSNVQNVFVYDTARDRDGGRWTGDERATSSSWYNETGSAASAAPVTGAACVIGTNNRCGIAGFPDKAILVVAGAAGANTLYIFDAKDNSLWMAFTQGASTALGASANNTMASVYALNGNIYVGTNGSAATGAYEINFKTDKMTRYNATDAEDFALGGISQRNASSGTAYVSQGRTAVKLTSVTVNDVFAQVVSGKTFFLVANGNATAANGGITVINETNQSVANLGPANENYQSIFYTADDIVYGLSSTSTSLDVWYGASNLSGNNVAKSTNYSVSTVPSLWTSAPTVNTSAPDALFVTNGTSDADGQSNTMYVGLNQGMVAIEEKVGDETGGAVKYYTNNMISEELFGDTRVSLPMAGSGTLPTNTTITKGTDGDVSVKQVDVTTKTATVTHSSGIRGTALTFNGTTDYLCTGTTGTCANNANVDVAQTNFSVSFWVKTTSAATTRVLVNKQVTPTTTAGYVVQLNASHQLTSTVTDGTTPITATSTRIADDNTWHFVTVTMNRPTTGAACSATNTCTLTQYIDGIIDGSATSTTMANSMTNANFLTLMANSAATAANFTTGSMDEFTFTARTLTQSQVQFMANVGYRALQNPNHAGATTIRGSSAAQDGANKLNGSTVVKAVNPLLDNGLIYIGGSGGVSAIGMYTDTLTDFYSTAINTKDDVNTNYDTTNGNAVNSVSVSKGYGTGILLGIGFNNATAGGLWAESNDTTVKDFLANSYNPFGNTLVQTNLIADRVFRVTNQISTRLDNFSIGGTAQPQLADIFRVDNNGAAIQLPTEAIDTNATGTVSVKGLTFSAVNNVTQSGAGTTDIRDIDALLPNITQTSGTLTATGANIKTGTITTNGTETGLNVDMSASTITTNGILTGLSISPPTTAQAAGTTRSIFLGTSTGATANTVDSATIAVGNIASTATNNYSTLNIQNGGTGFLDVELVRGMINFQSINTFQDDFTGRILDTTTKWTYAVLGTGTCSTTLSAAGLNGFLRATTGATIGWGCNLSTQPTLSNGFYQRGNNPVFESRVKVTSATIGGVRSMNGFSNASMATTVETLVAAHAWIGKKAADTAWQCVSSDGATESQTTTGVTIVSGTNYRLRVQVLNGTTPQVICTVDDGTTVTRISKTTNVPPAATAMDIYEKCETTDTTSDTCDYDYVRTWQDDPPLIAADASASLDQTGLTTNTGSVNDTTVAIDSNNTLSSTDSAGFVTGGQDATMSAEITPIVTAEPTQSVLQSIEKLIADSAIFNKIVEFFGSVIFHTDVAFLGRPTFNSDTAGFAVIKKGADRVAVSFDKEYEQRPVIAAGIFLGENMEATESAVFSSKINYIVTKVTTKGFMILLGTPTLEDTTFSWSAISIKDAKTAVSKEEVAGASIAAPTPTPTIIPSAPADTSTLTPTPTPDMSPGNASSSAGGN